MQRSELEVMCKWAAARLRCKGVNLSDKDPALISALQQAGLRTIDDIVDMNDNAIMALAALVGHGKEEAA